MNLLQRKLIKRKNNRTDYNKQINDLNVIDFRNKKEVKEQERKARKEKINLNNLDLEVAKTEYRNEFITNQFKTCRKSDNKDKKSYISLNIINCISVITSALLSLLGLYFGGYIAFTDMQTETHIKTNIASITISVIFFSLTIVNNVLVNNIPNYITKFVADRQSKSKLIGLIMVCTFGISFSCYSNKLFLVDYLGFNNVIGYISCLIFDLAQIVIAYLKYDRVNQNYSENYKDNFINENKKEVVKDVDFKTSQKGTDKGIEQPKSFAIGFNSQDKIEALKTDVNAKNKQGRKVDKRTIANIKSKIDKLESGTRITNKNISYTGSRDTLKRVCKDYLAEKIDIKTDANGKELIYKK